ncbi:glycoside hydrolase family 20 protein [Streptomyces abikoensis]|uniref:Beta-N-acetylglucosaminidase n=1 Tax=Streptomyces luteoverticillatus TaxID=66425 RepID=A0A3Q9G0B3_STRLT|nr:glycoside hydrolase family 20 protein [Streptomyces luteoverticillatus]AZQ73144.1 beta-N-acetylglucosaminidase [Streptomyces luteoverticillatus]
MGRSVRITRASAVRGTVASCALLATMSLMGCPRDGHAGHPGADDSRSAQGSAAAPAASPAASDPATVSPSTPVPQGPPAVVPAVREFTQRSGPGWRPAPGARVVAAAGKPADEARRLAADLGLTYDAGPARAGDVELIARAGQAGGPESYELTVQDRKVTVTAPEAAGLFYGTRTVVQAVRGGGGLPEGVIKDAPDRPQRGLNLDTARKHFTADWIESRLRELADLKLNQLGLHFSDDQGFRIESSSHPEVVSPQHLTKAELRRITTLASDLHITVVPEIDSPGHLGAVIAARPALQLRDASGTAARGAVDIGNPESARVVDDLLREFAPLFPGPWFHLGADEYRALMSRDPQAAYPRLAQLARRRFGPQGRVQDLATAWLNDRAAVVRGLGKTPKAWNDGFFAGGVVSPDKSIEVEYWTGKETGARRPQDYLNEGRSVVNLNDEYLYYVLGEPNDFRYPTGERIYGAWSPPVLRGTGPVPANVATGADRVPGGRLAVWCDRADAQSPEQVASGIRLPLAAVSQRLWDPRPPRLSWADFAALAAKVRR